MHELIDGWPPTRMRKHDPQSDGSENCIVAGKSPKPSVSVIIPTKNRHSDLDTIVRSLLAQTVLPTELIIVDQSARQTLVNPANLRIQYIYEPSLSGASTARNVGMAVATGDIWLFLDDDVVLESNFIEEIIAAYTAGVSGVSGIVTNYERPPMRQLFWEILFMRGPFLDDRQRIYRSADKLRKGLPIPVRQFGAGLMSFRASTIKDLRFDPNLTGASPGEDIDLCARLPMGSRLVMTPKARLVHRRSPEGRDATHWLSTTAQVSTYMRERHWKRGLRNNLSYFWLNAGYAMAAMLSSLKHASFKPWHAWREGVRKGKAMAHPNADRSTLIGRCVL